MKLGWVVFDRGSAVGCVMSHSNENVSACRQIWVVVPGSLLHCVPFLLPLLCEFRAGFYETPPQFLFLADRSSGGWQGVKASVFNLLVRHHHCAACVADPSLR